MQYYGSHDLIEMWYYGSHDPCFPGKYPVEAVGIMSRICLEAESAMFHDNVFAELRSLASKPSPTVQTIAIASVDAAFQQHAAAIITLTTTGTYV